MWFERTVFYDPVSSFWYIGVPITVDRLHEGA